MRQLQRNGPGIANRAPGKRLARLAFEWVAVYALAVGALVVWSQLPYWLQIPLCGLILPIMVYLATPVGAWLGAWEYLSSYLLLHRPSPRAPLALHLGMTYDLLWRLRPARRSGEALSTTFHRELYSGLHGFCERVERGEIERDTPVVACSYFLSGKQMARYGFHEVPTSWAKRLSFVLGYPEVLTQQWLLTGRLKLFNPLTVRAYRAAAGEVAARADYFARLAARSGGSREALEGDP